MKTYQLKFLAWTFSAFLPPQTVDSQNENEGSPNIDYYALLGVPSNAKPDDIKKAYRKRSLELHPDKLRQRGMKYEGTVITEDEARSRFQQMKSAYDALSDPKKRQVYDALGHQGMDFVVNPSHAWDPHVLLGNLAKSSVLDRAKLMMLVLVFFGLVLMQPILICTKIDQTLEDNGGGLIDSSWVALFIPFWLFSIGFGVVMVIGKAVLSLMQWIMFVLGVLLLTLKWDNVILANYAAVFIPFYLWMAIRCFAASKVMKDTRTDMSKMVTVEYIEKYILTEKKQDENGNDIEDQIHSRTYNDLSEEERDEINESFIIVHVPPKQSVPSEEQNESSMEGDLDQIERSPEYQEALIRHREAYKTVQHIVLPEIPLIILVIIQLDMNKNWDWGVVFIPLWISMVIECCGGCYGFFCTSALAHIEVEEAMAEHLETKKNASVHNTKDPKDEVTANFDKATENVEAATSCVKTMDKTNSEETADTIQDGEVDTAVVVEPPKNAKGDVTADIEKKDVTKNDTASFPNVRTEADDDKDECLDDMFSMDEDTFQYYQQAEQEAETKATEAQSKAIASFCNIIFQIFFAGLFVGKLNQVYDEEDEPDIEGTSSFSTFWIIFPLLLFAGCTVCCCFCAIFCAAEVDTHMTNSEDDAGDEVDETEAADQNKEEAAVIEQTLTSEGMEVDIEGQTRTKKVETASVAVKDLPEKKDDDSEMDDLD